jgi:hypothetical protein
MGFSQIVIGNPQAQYMLLGTAGPASQYQLRVSRSMREEKAGIEVVGQFSHRASWGDVQEIGEQISIGVLGDSHPNSIPVVRDCPAVRRCLFLVVSAFHADGVTSELDWDWAGIPDIVSLIIVERMMPSRCPFMDSSAESPGSRIGFSDGRYLRFQAVSRRQTPPVESDKTPFD